MLRKQVPTQLAYPTIRALSLVMLAMVGCGAPATMTDAGDSRDAGTSTSDAGTSSFDAGERDAGIPDAGAVIEQPDPPFDAAVLGDAGPPPCPADPPASGEITVFDDALGTGWSVIGGAPEVAVENVNVCSGSSAVRYLARSDRDFLQFYVLGAGHSGSRVSMRVHVDVPLAFEAAAYGADIPDGLPADWTGSLHAGWNLVEFDVPESVDSVFRVVLFKPGLTPRTLIVDDVRLTPR